MRQSRLLPLSTSISPNSLGILAYFLIPFILGTISIALLVPSWVAAATASIWALCCFISGFAVGLLFGIPKILQTDKPSDSQTSAFYKQQVNTNLEQISDWLTKIIVGLGLINLTNVPPILAGMAELLTRGLGLESGNTAFAQALIVFFTLLGFLCGYLFTRLFLAVAFSRADQTAGLVLNEALTFARTADSRLVKEVFSKINPNEFIDEASESEEFGNDNSESLDLELQKLEKSKQ